MLKNSLVSMINAFNIQKERIAKRFIINFFLLSSFLTLLAKKSLLLILLRFHIDSLCQEKSQTVCLLIVYSSIPASSYH